MVVRFADYTLDPDERRLTKGGEEVALKPKYFDALVLLAQHPGQLVTRDCFFETVWDGTVVGDEALTQAIKDLRRALGDRAAAPRFIETVPKQGYRFIARVENADTRPVLSSGTDRLRRAVLAGTLGGAAAGLVGGMFFGGAAGLGKDAALIILTVMTVLTLVIAALGAFGVTLGMALASRIAGRGFTFSVLGGALGGFVVGDLFHLIASGSFSVVLGTPHDDFTGGLEGLILGGALAIGARAGGGMAGRWPLPVVGAGLAGGAAGALIALGGGNLMASSLGALARKFHGAGADLGLLGTLTGEGASSLSRIAVAAGEGAMLGIGVTAAILLSAARKSAKNHEALT